MMAVDLGSRTSKAILLERRGEDLAMTRFAVVDAPIYDKRMSPELLADHLRQVSDALGSTTKSLALTMGLEDVIVRPVELPQIPVNEMRLVLKNNSKVYLQQDLPNHVFDCHIFPAKAPAAGRPPEAARTVGVTRTRVLAAAAKKQLVEDMQSAAKSAGLALECLAPGLISPVNAFELAMAKEFADETVALVDVGFKHSSICVLDHGELALTRMVNIGGDKLTAGLAESMNISYAEAEGIKVGMAPEVQSTLETLVSPLGRELRASLDFFEHQQDRPVTQIFVGGGSARSEMILQMLHTEMLADCKTWNPTGFLRLELPGQQMVEIEHVGSQLAVAIGAALAAL